MCGIFGTIAKKGSNYKSNDLKIILKDLALYSESRGKDSSGLALLNIREKNINVIKGNIRIKDLLKTDIASKNIINTFANIINNIYEELHCVIEQFHDDEHILQIHPAHL
jgi:glucosamine 6-phosphate synthetase-like amidotransferase/phosphosugar isomerase protein